MVSKLHLFVDGCEILWNFVNSHFVFTGEIKSRMVIINALSSQHINDWIFGSTCTQKEIAPV
jgi:hypothetical protein